MYADHSSNGAVDLYVTVDGFVTDARMNWKGSKGRYQYRTETGTNLDGRTATVSAGDGATDEATID